MWAAATVFASVLVAGAVGFRLRPDSSIYASGELLPNSIAAGLAGRVGGMWVLVVVSAIAAGWVFALLPGARARALFFALGGFWFVFPGADALGVLGVALMARRARGALLWPLICLLHLVSGLTALPLLFTRRFAWIAAAAIALGVVVIFAATSSSSSVSTWEHVAYMTRYLLPAAFLFCSSSRRTA
jgi:hypothetical protein